MQSTAHFARCRGKLKSLYRSGRLLEWKPKQSGLLGSVRSRAMDRKAQGVSRQTKRSLLRALAFQKMTDDYGGELRKVRRRMALGLAKREYRRHLFFGQGLEDLAS